MTNGNKDLKDYLQEGIDAAKPYVEKAREQVEPQLKKAMEQVEPQLKKAKERVEPQLKKAKERVEPQVKKARAKAEPVVKETVDRATKTMTKTEVFVQYDQFELRVDDITDKVREDYIAKGGTARGLKKLRVYIKPAEHAAYYVANQNETGRVAL